MRRLLVLLTASCGLLVGAQSASAAGCDVINDFNDNGVLNGTYSVSCLRSAINDVQGDARTYTEIIPVIQAKIYAAKRAEDLARQTQSSTGPDNRTNSGAPAAPSTTAPKDPTKPGTAAPGTSKARNTGAKDQTTTTKAGSDTTSGQATVSPSGSTTDSPDDALATPPTTTDRGLHAAIDGLGPKKATDVPTPVIVLGTLALGLIAVGSAGLVVRRRRGSPFDGSAYDASSRL